MPTLSAGAVGFGVAHWLGALPECVWARQRRGVAFRENHTVELVLVLATAGSITRSRTRQQYQKLYCNGTARTYLALVAAYAL